MPALRLQSVVLLGLVGQISTQERINAELLEAHTSLQGVGAEMQLQLEQAANQLVTLREQFEKGRAGAVTCTHSDVI